MGTGSYYIGTLLLVIIINLIRMTTCLSALRSIPRSVIAKSETDTEESRRVLGSSVVTSVSVVMNHGNETHTYFTNKIERPEMKTNLISSPGNLLNPDKYEFYTFDGTGDLIKRLMTWEEIQGLIAASDTDNVLSDAIVPMYYNENRSPDSIDDTRLTMNEFQSSDIQDVRKVVESVQNVLKSELAASQSKILPVKQPALLTNSPNWSLLLPNLFENVEDDGVADLHHLSNTIMLSTRNSSPSSTTLVDLNRPTNKNHSVNYFDHLFRSTNSAVLATSTSSIPNTASIPNSQNSGKTTFADENFKRTEKPTTVESAITKPEKTRPPLTSLSSSMKHTPPFSITTSGGFASNVYTTTPKAVWKKNSTTPQYDFYTSNRELFTAITNLLSQVNGQDIKIKPAIDAFELAVDKKRNVTTLNTKPSFFVNENENKYENMLQFNYYHNNTEQYTTSHDLARVTTEHDVSAQQAPMSSSNSESVAGEIFKYGTYFTSTTIRHGDNDDETTTSSHDLSTLRKQSNASTMKSIFHAQPASVRVNNSYTNALGDKNHTVGSNSSLLSESKTTTPITSVEPLVTWTSAYSLNEFQDDNVENNEISGLEKLVTEQYVSGSNNKPWFLKVTKNDYKNKTTATDIFTFMPFTQSIGQHELLAAKITPTRATVTGDAKPVTSNYRPHYLSTSNANASNISAITSTTTDTQTMSNDFFLHRIPTINTVTYAETKTESSPDQHKYSTFSRPDNVAISPSIAYSTTIRSSTNKHPQYLTTTVNSNTFSSTTSLTEIEMQRIPTIDPHNKTNAFQTYGDIDRTSSTKSSYLSHSSFSTESSVKNLTQIAIMMNKSNETTKYFNKNAEIKHKYTIKPNTAATLNFLSSTGFSDGLIDKHNSSIAKPIGQNGSFSPFLSDCITSMFSTPSPKISSDGDKNGNFNAVTKTTDNRVKNTNATNQETEMKNESSFQNPTQQKWPLADKQKENSHIYYYKLPPITSPQAWNVHSGGGSHSSSSGGGGGGGGGGSGSGSTSMFLDAKIKNNSHMEYTNDNKTSAHHHQTTNVYHRKPNPTLPSQKNSTVSITTSEPTDKHYEKITTVEHPSFKPMDAAIKTIENYHGYHDVTQSEILRNELSTVTSHLLQTEARISSIYPTPDVTPHQLEALVSSEYLQNREAFEGNTFIPQETTAAALSSSPKTTVVLLSSSSTDTNRRIAEKNDPNERGNDQISDNVNETSSSLYTSISPVVQVHKNVNDKYNTASPTSNTSRLTPINELHLSSNKRISVFTTAPSTPPFIWSNTTIPTHQVVSELIYKSGQFIGQDNNGTTTTTKGKDSFAEEQIPYKSKIATSTTELPAVKNYDSRVDERYKYSSYPPTKHTQNYKNNNDNDNNSTIFDQQQSNDIATEKKRTTITPLHTFSDQFSFTNSDDYNSNTTTTTLGDYDATYQSANGTESVGTNPKDNGVSKITADIHNHEKSNIDDASKTNKSTYATIPINTSSTSASYQTGAFRSPINSSIRSSTIAPNTIVAVELHPAPHENMGLEASIAYLGDDVKSFVDLCNELSFKTWTTLTANSLTTSRSMVLSPFALISNLAMIFLGARGSSSGIMNDLLRLDDMVTFNPHQVLRNITESVVNSRNIGVANVVFIRQIFSDKSKGNVLEFYKERLQQYYDTHIEEINFNIIGDLLRRRTNLLVKRQTQGKIQDYLKGSTLTLKPPLAALTTNIFQTNCEVASTDGRDGEMYFVVRPSNRQRRLIPIPAVVYRGGFLAGYEPGLDATAVTLSPDSIISTVFVLPGQQGQVAPGDGLARLEQRLLESSYRRGAWSRLLRSLLFRHGLEVQLPRFSHKSVLNLTLALQKMGLNEIFSPDKADLRGINGLPNQLHLSDIVQLNTFSMCGEDSVGARHHIETFPSVPQRLAKNQHLYSQNNHQYLAVPLNLRPRQARLPDNPRLRFDRPFLYLVRHNPSGMILYIGRFNPRLLP